MVNNALGAIVDNALGAIVDKALGEKRYVALQASLAITHIANVRLNPGLYLSSRQVGVIGSVTQLRIIPQLIIKYVLKLYLGC